MDPIKKRQKILWLDDDPEVLASAQRLFRQKDWELTAVTSVEEARSLLLRETFAVLVADEKLEGSRGADLLAFSKTHSPSSARILLTGFVDNTVVEDAVNRGAVFRFVSKPWDNDELLLDISKAIEHHELRITQQSLLREVTTQNKRLEDLSSGLEQLVAERTLHAEQSKVEAEKKLSHVRDLVRFIKDLSVLNSLDELMGLMRKEVKGFHELRAPMLGYLIADRKPMLLYFQGKQVSEKEARQTWSTSSRLRLNELEDRIYLANEFGRPLVKVLAIPLKRRAISIYGENEAPATLFFEHTLPDGQIDDFLGFISERLQPLSIAIDRILLEYHLKYTSLQWESTFDGIKDPIAIIDIDYSVVRTNRHFSPKSYQTKCHKLFASSETVCRGCPVEKALSTGQPQKSQIKRGKSVFEVLSYPIRLHDETAATNVINHYVDVTSARELHGRLVQSEKMAAIGHLAGNIAHELNNPLTGIRSLAQVLRSEIPKETQLASDIKEVEQAAERSQKIIENLLDFSKGSSEKQVRVSLNDVVNRTLPMLKTALRDHRSEILLSEVDAMVRVEPHLMQQVVFNLVNNACQAMTEPGTLTVETLIAETADWCELRVKDTGDGIAADIIENIFEPFFTTKVPGQGTGLGLSMSQSIIQKFGGQIFVESQMGQGSEFIVRLPVVIELKQGER